MNSNLILGAHWDAQTLPDIIAKAHAGLRQGAGRPAVLQRAEELTIDIAVGTPEKLAATVKHETALYSKIIRGRYIRLQ